MLTLTDQLLRHVGVLNVASVRVSVAHATATNADVLDRVEILQHELYFSEIDKIYL